MPIDVWLPSEALATSAAHVRATGCDPVELLQGKQRSRRGRPRLDRSVRPRGGVARDTAIQVRSATLDTFVVLRRWSRRGGGTAAPGPPLHCAEDGRRFPSLLSRLQNSLGCGLNSRFPGEHSVVLDCRLRVLGREDSSGEPRCVERRPSTCLHRHRWMTGPGRAPALDRRLADDTLFVTSPGARAGRRSAPARRTCSGTSPSRRRGRGHGDRRTRP